MFYIYEIKCGDYVYIGSTSNKRKRKTEHLRKLKSKTHVNKFFQNVYNKYQTYEFSIIKECISLEIMKMEEEQYILSYKELYDKKCMNILIKYSGGNEWRKYKTVEELQIIDAKRINLSPEKRKKRNSKHRQTLQNKDPEEKRITYEKRLKTLNQNKKRWKSFKVKITYPDDKTILEIFESELDFFTKTNLEETSLRELKNTGIKIIKKRLYWTRHNYPVKTTLEIVE